MGRRETSARAVIVLRVYGYLRPWYKGSNGETLAVMCANRKSRLEALDVENVKARPNAPGFFLAGGLSGDAGTRLH